ncbi:MAG: PD-(D/E)XK nuclease family protein [Candidatus Omnitrophica bacterium]|nr:PD-(D/E)XK nuclease family protein [Candidatus Omnitrophota bacterium]
MSVERIRCVDFSDDFIQCCCDFILSGGRPPEVDLSRTAVVFGGKRPALFLQRALSERIGTACFPPVFFTRESFWRYFVEKKFPAIAFSDTLDACFEIFALVQKIAPDILKGRERLAQFLPWARELIDFFDLLDEELIGAAALSRIETSARIGYDVPKNLNVLISRISSVRDAYRAFLQREGKFSRGRLYEEASRHAADIPLPEFDRVIFAHFFSMSAAELHGVTALFERGIACLLLQRNAEPWPPLDKICRQFGLANSAAGAAPRYPPITLHAGFDQHSQASIVRSLLVAEPDPASTVVVVPDSSALIPLLTEISGEITDYNVSLGYPAQRTALFGLFELILRAQETRRGSEYYTRDLLAVLNHPLMKNVQLFSQAAQTRALVQRLAQAFRHDGAGALGGALYVTLSDIEPGEWAQFPATEPGGDPGAMPALRAEQIHAGVRALLQLAFRSWEKIDCVEELCRVVEGFITAVMGPTVAQAHPLNSVFAARVMEFVHTYRAKPYGREPLGGVDLIRIFLNLIGGERMTLPGTPLKGLQILGLYETRALKFQQVVIMDVNEGVLPAVRSGDPLIPRQVLLELGIDRTADEEIIQRYQFMRLLGGAAHAHLIFDDRQDKQKSRFIESLIWMAERQQRRLRVLPIFRYAFRVKTVPEKKSVAKSAAVCAVLEEMVFSASSINTYLECPLRFYYQYVLGLREQEDLLEEPQSAEIGTFIHRLLERAYRDSLGSVPQISANFLNRFWSMFAEFFEQAFVRRMRSEAFLLEQVLRHRLQRFWDFERERDRGTIIALEQPLRGRIAAAGIAATFTAQIDRIDRAADGGVVVFDYKTGSSDLLPRRDAALAAICAQPSREAIVRGVRSFQLPIYAELAAQCYAGEDVAAALYNVRLPALHYFPAERGLRGSAGRERCRTLLLWLVAEIRDPRAPFEPDPVNGHCSFCPFRAACH